MIKLLLLIAVLLVAYLLWRGARMSDSSHGGSAKPEAKPQDMVSCPVCAVHLPRADAVAGADGRLYCSQEHRLSASD
jgi:uncharacterized protein